MIDANRRFEEHSGWASLGGCIRGYGVDSACSRREPPMRRSPARPTSRRADRPHLPRVVRGCGPTSRVVWQGEPWSDWTTVLPAAGDHRLFRPGPPGARRSPTRSNRRGRLVIARASRFPGRRHYVTTKLPRWVAYDAGQVEALAEFARTGRVAALVFAYCGLRWSERAALRVRHFDLLRRRLTIEEGATEINGGRIVWGTPKSHERRSVPIPARLWMSLHSH
jgi:integrase